MVKELVKLANHLDNKGFQKESDYLDAIIKKLAEASEGDELGPDNENSEDMVSEDVLDIKTIDAETEEEKSLGILIEYLMLGYNRSEDPSTRDRRRDEIASLINDRRYSEALKELREEMGTVDPFMDDRQDFVSDLEDSDSEFFEVEFEEDRDYE